MKSLKYWIFLAVSIVLEVSGTSIMKLSQASNPVIGMLIMYALLAVSYYFLALAIKRLPIGVACAFWEGFGLILISAVSVMVLEQRLSTMQMFALALVFIGSMLVNSGTEEAEKPRKKISLNAMQLEA